MQTAEISMTELKQNMGEVINQVAYGNQRVLLLSRGKAHAALISVADLQKLVTIENAIADTLVKEQQLALLTQATKLREQMQKAGQQTDSVAELRQLREARVDEITNLR